jgi:uncharacterized membrane protein
MGYGFGFPLFNFYPPLPYLIGEIFRIFGASFVTTVKLVFALSFLASGIAMYLLAKEFFPPTLKLRRTSINLGAILSAVFYIWAPYHAVDVYVRGAMNEAWSLAWFPLIFWAAYRLIKEKKKALKWIIVLSLSWFALLTSHNLMVLIFTSLFGVWCLFWLWQKKTWGKIPRLVVSGIWALGLAAFFTLPAVLENRFTHIKSVLVGYYDYTAHFASIGQLLFSRFWGYGPSVWMTQDDRMSFQVGHLHWGLSLVILGLIIWKILKKKTKETSILFLASYLILAGWLATFLAHPRSIFIWKLIPFLKFLQFPWRFLSIVIFCFSFVAGAIVLLIKNKKTLLLSSSLLIASLLILNWNYFKPEHGHMGALTDSEKFTGAAWELQQTAGIYDYLPIAAKTAPKEARKVLAEIVEGKGLPDRPAGEPAGRQGGISDEKQGTKWAEFKANIDSDQAVVRIGIFEFPEWKIFVDGKEVETFVDKNEEWGRMYIKLPQGTHHVRAEFHNTPIRTLANLISLVSWGVLLTVPIWRKKFTL